MKRTGASRGVDVLENRDALPRAWIVHSAKRVSQAPTLQLLNSGDVNPRLTALIERQPPDLSNPEDASNDRALIKTHEVDRICLQTSSAAPGLLVLSEAYYPAWKAHVDGRPRAASGPQARGRTRCGAALRVVVLAGRVGDLANLLPAAPRPDVHFSQSKKADRLKRSPA